MAMDTNDEAGRPAEVERRRSRAEEPPEITPLPGMCERCLITVHDGFNLGCPHGGHERAGESPINVKLLDRVQEQLESVRVVERHGEDTLRLTGTAATDPGAREHVLDQLTWRDHLRYDFDVEDGDQPTRCGTSMCTAGWTDHLDGLPGERIWAVPDKAVYAHEEGSSLLVARADDPDGHLKPTWYWKDAFEDGVHADERVVDASMRAERLLGFERTKDLVIGRDGLRGDDPAHVALRAALNEVDPEGEWMHAVWELFSGDNTMDDLRRLFDDLREFNAWLMDHLARTDARGEARP